MQHVPALGHCPPGREGAGTVTSQKTCRMPFNQYAPCGEWGAADRRRHRHPTRQPVPAAASLKADETRFTTYGEQSAGAGFCCACMDYGPLHEEPFAQSQRGVFITCEGNCGWDNASLSFYDPAARSVENEIFIRERHETGRRRSVDDPPQRRGIRRGEQFGRGLCHRPGDFPRHGSDRRGRLAALHPLPQRHDGLYHRPLHPHHGQMWIPATTASAAGFR